MYIDVDVECVRPMDSLFEPLEGAAWTGDFPEPMFVASVPGARVWLRVLKRIAQVWPHLDAWKATGPAGLNKGIMEYIQKYGSKVLLPFITKNQVSLG